MEKTKVILYHAVSWCGPCQRFMPAWNEAKEDLEKEGYVIEEFDYDDAEGKEQMKKDNVKSFPTLRVVLPDESPVEPSGSVSQMSAEEVKQFVKSVSTGTGIREEPAPEAQAGGACGLPPVDDEQSGGESEEGVDYKQKYMKYRLKYEKLIGRLSKN